MSRLMDQLEQQGGICRECQIARGYRPMLDYVKLCARHAAMAEWQPIETAPLNQSVLIFIASPVAEHYGPAIYRGLCVRAADGKGLVWKVTGLHFGSDVGGSNWPTHWMPLPDPPKAEDLNWSYGR